MRCCCIHHTLTCACGCYAHLCLWVLRSLVPVGVTHTCACGCCAHLCLWVLRSLVPVGVTHTCACGCYAHLCLWVLRSLVPVGVTHPPPAYCCALVWCPLQVPRQDQFAPVKNAPGSAGGDCPDTARAALLQQVWDWAALGTTMPACLPACHSAHPDFTCSLRPLLDEAAADRVE
jgi:hypothetical protein